MGRVGSSTSRQQRQQQQQQQARKGSISTTCSSSSGSDSDSDDLPSTTSTSGGRRGSSTSDEYEYDDDDDVPRSAAAAQPHSRAPASLLVSSHLPSEILSPGDDGTFVRTDQLAANVNLRHFKLQTAKYASVSDIVVYGPHGPTDKVLETARRCREAQIEMRNERLAHAGRAFDVVEYNTFVITGA